MSALSPHPRVEAFVFARGGSKGVPGKNLRELGGVTLVGRAIDAALASRWINRVTVSTDCPEIAAVARAHGAGVPWLRPAELADDTANEWMAWRHAIDAVEAANGPFDLFVSVPATAPLRSPEDIDRCIEVLLDAQVAGTADLAMTVTPTSASPWFNLVAKADDGLLGFAVPGGGTYTRRQDVPESFELTPVAYVTTPAHIRSVDRVFAGRIVGSLVPRERAIDIDDEVDLALAEVLLQRVSVVATGPICGALLPQQALVKRPS